MTRYTVIKMGIFDHEKEVDTFLSITDALTYADLMNRLDDMHGYFVRHDTVN
jgi:hypothetical protein